MPVHLTPLTRRQFLNCSLAAGAGILTLRRALGAKADGTKTDPDSFALLADTHIPAGVDIKAYGVNTSANLRKVAAELLAMKKRPAGAFVAGDCALKDGQTKDYVTLAGLLAPLAEARLPVHLAPGNHDHRERMVTQFKPAKANAEPVKGKHVGIVESARANWFVLDSLWRTNVVTGILGKAQLGWLAKALDARKDKPAIIVAHHNPQWIMKGRRFTGLKDTAALFEIMTSRPHVKAYVHGHTHNWKLSQRKSLHVVNLPPTGYVFGPLKLNKPIGWVHAHLRDDGVTLRPRCLDAKHALHGKDFKLTWRPDKA